MKYKALCPILLSLLFTSTAIPQLPVRHWKISELSPCVQGRYGRAVWVKDGQTKSDCSIGGGNSYVWCLCINDEWRPVPDFVGSFTFPFYAAPNLNYSPLFAIDNEIIDLSGPCGGSELMRTTIWQEPTGIYFRAGCASRSAAVVTEAGSDQDLTAARIVAGSPLPKASVSVTAAGDIKLHATGTVESDRCIVIEGYGYCGKSKPFDCDDTAPYPAEGFDPNLTKKCFCHDYEEWKTLTGNPCFVN